MTEKEKLLLDLIFSDKSDFTINISNYIEELYKYDRFIDEVKSILKKSKVKIIKESFELDKNGPIWSIKVKK